MQYFFGWAQQPMLMRLKSQLDPSIPITIIYGERTWLDAINQKQGRTADLISRARPEGAYVGVNMIREAGHHVHAEKPAEFNEIMKELLKRINQS